ncbi:MAG TPA: SLC13 family permease, partial [Chloroflexota bacterium]|nr:SLC13 family permease [Chloroflexota bacterium]
MNEIGISFAVLAAVVALFVWNRLPVELVAVGAGLALYFTGVLDLGQALAGFGDPTVLFIATLFVVGEALDATGVTAWAGQQLIARAGASRARLLVLTMLMVALLTALISVNGSVAALYPVVVVMAVRVGLPPSKLLLPLAFGAHAGSLLALTGTPVSVIVSEAAAEAGARPFGFFEFALVGVPLVLGTLAVVVLFGERLLPHRSPRHVPPDFSQHLGVLTEHYGLDRPTPRLAADGLLEVLAGPAGDDPDALLSPQVGVAEVVIRPRSGLIGTAMFPGMVTESGELVVLAIQRGGEDRGPRETELQAGDALLVRGTWAALDEHLTDPDVLVVDAPERVRRQAVPLGRGSRPALAVLAGMVVLLTTGVVPAVVAGLLAVGAILLLRVLTMEQAYRGIAWTTVVLVAGMTPLSTAMQETGAAALIAETLIGVVGGAGPHALVFGLVLLTVAFGQLISNMATAF